MFHCRSLALPLVAVAVAIAILTSHLAEAAPAVPSSPMMGSASAGGGSAGQRTAVLRSATLSGVRNVRWETSPMSSMYVDGSGKPMAAPPAGKTSAGGGCMDVKGGSQPSGGPEYERPNGHFKYRCVDGVEEVVACVGSNRTNKARIEVGQTLDVGGFWHKCENSANGSTIYTQESTCTSEGKDYRVGEEVQVGYLRLQCQPDGYKVVGCYYHDPNGKVVPMNAGEQKPEGKTTHFCEEKDDQITYFNKGSGCTRAGLEYKEGDTFSEKHLRFQCTNGIADITGCYVDEQHDLPVGQDLMEKNGRLEGENTTGQVVHRCYRNGGRVEYSEYACGYNGTPTCTPEPMPRDNVEEEKHAARGVHTPGFGAFAVAQKAGGGSSMVADPSTLRLELDKLMAAHAGQQ